MKMDMVDLNENGRGGFCGILLSVPKSED